jgi:hypothetical protein
MTDCRLSACSLTKQVLSFEETGCEFAGMIPPVVVFRERLFILGVSNLVVRPLGRSGRGR